MHAHLPVFLIPGLYQLSNPYLSGQHMHGHMPACAFPSIPGLYQAFRRDQLGAGLPVANASSLQLVIDNQAAANSEC
jgi:hypothetical protein